MNYPHDIVERVGQEHLPHSWTRKTDTPETDASLRKLIASSIREGAHVAFDAVFDVLQKGGGLAAIDEKLAALRAKFEQDAMDYVDDL